MKKSILLLIAIFSALFMSAQIQNTAIKQIQNDTTQFGVNLPSGTIVRDMTTNSLYSLDSAAIATLSLSTAYTTKLNEEFDSDTIRTKQIGYESDGQSDYFFINVDPEDNQLGIYNSDEGYYLLKTTDNPGIEMESFYPHYITGGILSEITSLSINGISAANEPFKVDAGTRGHITYTDYGEDANSIFDLVVTDKSEDEFGTCSLFMAPEEGTTLSSTTYANMMSKLKLNSAGFDLGSGDPYYPEARIHSSSGSRPSIEYNAGVHTFRGNVGINISPASDEPFNLYAEDRGYFKLNDDDHYLAQEFYTEDVGGDGFGTLLMKANPEEGFIATSIQQDGLFVSQLSSTFSGLYYSGTYDATNIMLYAEAQQDRIYYKAGSHRFEGNIGVNCIPESEEPFKVDADTRGYAKLTDNESYLSYKFYTEDVGGDGFGEITMAANPEEGIYNEVGRGNEVSIFTVSPGRVYLASEGDNSTLYFNLLASSDKIQYRAGTHEFTGNTEVHGDISKFTGVQGDACVVNNNYGFIDCSSVDPGNVWVKVTGNKTAYYSTGLRVQIVADGGDAIEFATVESVSFDGSNTTIVFTSDVNLLWDEYGDEQISCSTQSPIGANLAIGYGTETTGLYSSAFGYGTKASGSVSCAMGYKTEAGELYSFAGGYLSTASGDKSLAFGSRTEASGSSSIAIGSRTVASGTSSYAEGSNSVASGNTAHAEGLAAHAIGDYSHSEGGYTSAEGDYSHAEGIHTIASGSIAHAEGHYTVASGMYSHAEGNTATASGESSHAQGRQTVASGISSSATGRQTTASGGYSHAQGFYTTASGESAYAAGMYSNASGDYSYASGVGYNATQCPTAVGRATFVHQEVEVSQFSKYAEGDNSAILGGKNNATTIGAINSVVLGGSGQTATRPNTAYAQNIENSGGHYDAIKTITANYTTTTNDYSVLSNSATDISVTLQSDSENTGQTLRFYNYNSSGNLNIVGNYYGAGCNTATLAPGGSIIIQFDGTAWAVFSSNNMTYTNCP